MNYAEYFSAIKRVLNDEQLLNNEVLGAAAFSKFGRFELRVCAELAGLHNNITWRAAFRAKTDEGQRLYLAKSIGETADAVHRSLDRHATRYKRLGYSI